MEERAWLVNFIQDLQCYKMYMKTVNNEYGFNDEIFMILLLLQRSDVMDGFLRIAIQSELAENDFACNCSIKNGCRELISND